MTGPTPAAIAAELFAREGAGKAWDLSIEDVAEASEIALASRGGVYSVSITTSVGRTLAQSQGHSRAIGGTVNARD